MQPDYEKRRADDAERAMFQAEIKHIQELATSTSEALNRHVTHCAKIQTYGALVGTGTLAWLVGHSPEAEKIATKIISIFW